MHAVVCRIQQTLERVVIRAGLIQQLTTPQQCVAGAKQHILYNLFGIKRFDRQVQCVNLARARTRINGILVLRRSLCVTGYHHATPQQCFTQNHLNILFGHQRRSGHREIQRVVQTVACRTNQTLQRIMIRARLIQLLATPQQRITLADCLILNGLVNSFNHTQV